MTDKEPKNRLLGLFVKVKNLRKRQKIILLIAFIIVFYFLIL